MGEAKILTKKGITFPPAKILGIYSALMFHGQNLTGGESNEKNVDEKNRPPLILSIYSPHHYFAI